MQGQHAADGVSSAASGGMPGWAIALLVLGGLALAGLIVFLVVLSQRKERRAARRLCGACHRAMLPQWERCVFCGWVPPPPAAQVEFICGPLAGSVVTLHAPVTTIGSVGGNSIVLPDPAVSKKHVGIRRDGGGYELADLGSTNGVYVNGQRTAKRLLVPGDIIRVGTSEMVFRLGKLE